MLRLRRELWMLVARELGGRDITTEKLLLTDIVVKMKNPERKR